jgi:MFS family permease
MLYSLHNYSLYAFALVLCGMGFGTLMAWVNSKAVEGLKREHAPSIMAFVSMGMYLGQFLAPILSNLLSNKLGITSLRFPYILAIIVIIITFIMVCLERRRQNEVYHEA